MTRLEWEDIEDLLLGCAVLATGGGGALENGLAVARAAWVKKGPVDLVSLEELGGDDLVVSPYFVGAVAPAAGEGGALATLEGYEPLLAVQALERFLGRRAAAVVATELGGGNTAAALVVAAMAGVPLVDGDPAGRAVPELFHSTFYLDGVPIAPFALASAAGDVAVVERVGDDFRAEAIARAFAVASGDRAGVADHPVTGEVARRSLIPGTLTRAREVGRAIRAARAEGRDPVAAAAQAAGGLMVFRGEVAEESSYRIAGGLTHGEVRVAGRGRYRGREMHVAFRNEHMVARVDGAVAATVPDLICLLGEDGTPVLNPAIPAGLGVAVVVFPAPERWRSPQGLRVLGPRYAGLEEDYVPAGERCRSLGLGE